MTVARDAVVTGDVLGELIHYRAEVRNLVAARYVEGVIPRESRAL